MFPGQLNPIAFDVDDLIFATGLSDADLNGLVPNAGGFTTLTSGNGTEFTLENGLTFGGANIVSSIQTDNGWIHILDGIPSAVPEPGSLPLLMVTGLFGLTAVRRRK